MTSEKPKVDFYREAAQFLNAGERAAAESGEGVGGTLSFLTRGTQGRVPRLGPRLSSEYLGIQQLATRSMDDALRSFEGVLAEKPTNVIALLGKVRPCSSTMQPTT
jgi:RNA polymerase-associated protein CTR9